VTPTQTLTGQVAGPLTVRAGEIVALRDAVLSGSVTVQAGGGLLVDNSVITGSVTANRATAFEICGSLVGTDVTAKDSDAFVRIGDRSAGCAGNIIGGKVVLEHDRFGVSVSDNSVGADVHFTENTGATALVVAGNVVAGELGGTGNGAITNAGSPNIANRKTGDFVGL
jgi:hypothetical protein